MWPSDKWYEDTTDKTVPIQRKVITDENDYELYQVFEYGDGDTEWHKRDKYAPRPLCDAEHVCNIREDELFLEFL